MDYPKRVKFKPGEQRRFIEFVCGKCNLSTDDLAKIIGLHSRSIRDWKREKLSMSLPALKILCKQAKIPIPQNITIKDPFWYTSNGSPAGAQAVLKKYGYIGGNPEYRKKKWYEWWNNSGKFSKNEFFETRKIIKPKFSNELAEFVGIIIGDGGITERQVSVTLNKKDDNLYAQYVAKLTQNLFGILPSFYDRGSVWNLVTSRTELVKFLINTGLSKGNKVKNQISVPDWIYKNDNYCKFCIRGLVDTDGCFYIEKHRYKNKVYHNCAINLTNRSLPVLNFFKTKLEKFGFHSRYNNKFSVCMSRENEIIRYFDDIGSSNKKHYDKYIAFIKNKYGGVPKWS